ncbi:MAG: hypothetical protein HQL32_00585 [Planctomycetes bacterium]|nr:hypothetical protein [Planctomycetota bacterium]
MTQKNQPPASKWLPLDESILLEINEIFQQIYPSQQYGQLAQDISLYWQKSLKSVWENKNTGIRNQDLAYNPEDPLSRIEQKMVAIVYADSVQSGSELTLKSLKRFLDKYFPHLKGLHMLPACKVNHKRFNDGFFSQVVRDEIDDNFGSNDDFAQMMSEYYSMADFVLNHVDIDNPTFQEYLAGDDTAGECFYIFSEEEYLERTKIGDFKDIFRPRPFPLFTIFRRKPKEDCFSSLSLDEQLKAMKGKISDDLIEEIDGLSKNSSSSDNLIGLLYLFNKIKNDQSLLIDDYNLLSSFTDDLKANNADLFQRIFIVSPIQETKYTPYTFHSTIQQPIDLLKALSISETIAEKVISAYHEWNESIFGQEIRALTTFSHVQVDLNLGTYLGLKMLADDFSWYLSMDLNMLRLDAANFAFKKWQTSCFGLEEVNQLMKILYLSMEAVSPRIVANLEVNNTLTSILTQMANKDAPPPMMYDFHLAGIMPALFATQDASILSRIFSMIKKYDIPHHSIRFSLAESHDGKSVRGSMDILKLGERQLVANIIEKNGGRVKYKSVPSGKISQENFRIICQEAGVDEIDFKKHIFANHDSTDEDYILADELGSEDNFLQKANLCPAQEPGVIQYFMNQIVHGREPYELCSSTRDALEKLEQSELEVKRYLAFYTLAFALMGRNVKSIYFNDLLALANDQNRSSESGELRDLKRTKSIYEDLELNLNAPNDFMTLIATGLNHLIYIVDNDMALNPRGQEAEIFHHNDLPKHIACITLGYQESRTIVLVNLSSTITSIPQNVVAELSIQSQTDLISSIKVQDNCQKGQLALKPFQTLWLKE